MISFVAAYRLLLSMFLLGVLGSLCMQPVYGLAHSARRGRHIDTGSVRHGAPHPYRRTELNATSAGSGFADIFSRHSSAPQCDREKQFSCKPYQDTWSSVHDTPETLIAGGPVYFFAHIPKTAGSSFCVDGNSIVDGSFVSEETCMPQFISWANENGIDARHITFLRNPIAHVVSMYDHCTSNPCVNHLGHYTMTDWLTGIVQDGNSRGCYAPRDMMVRMLSQYCLPNQWMPPDQDAHEILARETPENFLEEAQYQLQNNTFFFGIAEYYGASLCYLHYKIDNVVPSGCNCQKQNLKQAVQTAHLDHDVTHTDLNALSDNDRETIATITAKDQKLYKFALELFRANIREAEQDIGFPILCEDSQQTASILL